MTLQIRRGTNTQREQLTNSNPVLAGELLYVTDQQALYIGTGESGDEQGILIASEATANPASIATLLTTGVQNDISFTYDTNTRTITSSVDLSSYTGALTALSIETQTLIVPSTLLVSDESNSRATIKIQSPDAISVVKLTRTATTDLSSDNTTVYGSIYFERDDTINNALTTGIISGGNNFIKLTTISAGEYLDINTVALVSGKLGVGNIAPTEKLDVTGNAVVSGFTKTGSFTTTSRNALTPAVGMIIYNTTLNKFQGYQHTDGITLEWVNLS